MSNICYKYSVVFSTEDWVLDVIVSSPDDPDTVSDETLVHRANILMSSWGIDPLLHTDTGKVAYLGSELVVPETI